MGNDRFFLISKRWDDTSRTQIKYITGEFESLVNARIFRDAYNENYCTDAVIVTEYELLNRVD